MLSEMASPLAQANRIIVRAEAAAGMALASAAVNMAPANEQGNRRTMDDETIPRRVTPIAITLKLTLLTSLPPRSLLVLKYVCFVVCTFGNVNPIQAS